MALDKYELVKCPYDAHPDRCQAVIPAGQCDLLAVPGSRFCGKHGGNAAVQQQDKTQIRNYYLGIWQSRLQQQATSPVIKSLRDEIGILRIMLEERFKMCKNTTDIILHSAPLTALITEISKVVSSCHKIEGQMGQMLDKSAVIQFAGTVVEILSEEVSPEIVERIANRLAQELVSEPD